MGEGLWAKEKGAKNAEEMVFRKNRAIASCSSEILFPSVHCSLLLFLFGVQVMCIRQRRISHCSSEKEEGRLSFLVLYVTLKPRYFFGALIQTKPIELIFPLISLWLLHKVFKRVVISAGGRLAGSLVWRLVPSAADMHKTRQLPLKKRVMSALWRETVFLPLTDLRFFLPTLGAARS